MHGPSPCAAFVPTKPGSFAPIDVNQPHGTTEAPSESATNSRNSGQTEPEPPTLNVMQPWSFVIAELGQYVESFTSIEP